MHITQKEQKIAEKCAFIDNSLITLQSSYKTRIRIMCHRQTGEFCDVRASTVLQEKEKHHSQGESVSNAPDILQQTRFGTTHTATESARSAKRRLENEKSWMVRKVGTYLRI